MHVLTFSCRSELEAQRIAAHLRNHRERLLSGVDSLDLIELKLKAEGTSRTECWRVHLRTPDDARYETYKLAADSFRIGYHLATGDAAEGANA